MISYLLILPLPPNIWDYRFGEISTERWCGTHLPFILAEAGGSLNRGPAWSRELSYRTARATQGCPVSKRKKKTEYHLDTLLVISGFAAPVHCFHLSLTNLWQVSCGAGCSEMTPWE